MWPYTHRFTPSNFPLKKEILPGNTRKLKTSKEIEQISQTCDTPLRAHVSKPKRDNKQRKDQTKPIKIIVWILEVNLEFSIEHKHV